MDTKLIIGKVIDGKTIISAKFDESTQFTTVYFDDNTFRVFTPDEASEVFTDENTFVHVVTQDDLAANPELVGVVTLGDLISAPMGTEPNHSTDSTDSTDSTLTSDDGIASDLQTDVTTQTQND